MTYTVQVEFFMDDDEIRTDEYIINIVKEIFSGCNCDASHVKVLAVDD